MFGPLLDVQMSFRVAGARDCAPCQKWAKRDGFVAYPKRWQVWDIWRGSAKMDFAGRRSTRDMLIRDVERGCLLEHQTFRFAKMILRDRCSTSYDPASLFRRRRNTSNRWNGKIAMFEGSLRELLCFWCCQLENLRKSRRTASILTLSSSKIEEVSQNCCASDVVKFENWRSLAE